MEIREGVQAPRRRPTLALGQAPRRFGVFASTVVAGVVFGAALSLMRNPAAFEDEAVAEATEISTTIASTAPALAAFSPLESIQVRVRRNETLDAIFRRLELSLNDLAALRALPDVRRSLDRLRPGDLITLTHLNGELSSLTRQVDDTRTLWVTRAPEGFKTDIVQRPLEIRTSSLAGSIDSSLFEAVNDAGGTEQLAIDLAEVFRYDIDFVNDVQAGDSFKVAYEQRFRDGEFVRNGDILAAEFVNEGKTYRAVRYVMPDGTPQYFTPDGRQLRKAFLRFPVAFGRVSSGFSRARWHPVLNRVRAHKGIDFAAPIGTPVKAAGDGRVEFRGIKGGYGNVLVVRHSGGVTTLYGHLSRFARGLGQGDRVKQGETIGYVGMTGLATGPHLHYEYRVNGVHRDPAKVKTVPADPLPANLRQDFLAKTRPLLVQLDQSPATPRVAQAD